eukprot:CAMPEP_0201578228 /NCGR_PEP_ID=MMETSP0190_2-20130828/25021_1 /ASSEMBLY_ACC=CAM_ASM_000263 /TAXON_ID=37353 /ORGANISM="Rosalina sp." /LENGTH=174 /DNA_ID=CAMNT_0048011181 /DNA_START=38 /DNA_END=559 /DNA_ORIENTATION=+
MADDWSRSSFFNPDTETTTLVPIRTPDADDDADDSQDDFNIDFPDNNQNGDDYADDSEDDQQVNDQNTPTNDEPVSDNPIMNELVNIMIRRFEHLVERGFLNPSFLTKIKTDPQEILRFIRQNRAVVGDQLNRRLDPTIRPKPEQLERLGIVPRGYFKAGQHAQAMKRKHRRKS